MARAFEMKTLPLRPWLAAIPRLGRGEVHVILVHLPSPTRAGGIPRVLDAEERRRQRRFAFAADRHRFAWSHAVLRAVLGRYLGRPAAAVQFARRPDLHAQPTLPPGARLRLRFSLSHAQDFAAVAVARGASVGVDVETARDGLDPLAVAQRHFAASETRAIAARTGRARDCLFLDFWTAKEAVLKALGTGLLHPLSDVVFGLGRLDRPQLREIVGGRFAHRRFSIRSQQPKSPMPSSLTVAGPAGNRAFFLWTGEAATMLRAAGRSTYED